jgi:hypothetical protein
MQTFVKPMMIGIGEALTVNRFVRTNTSVKKEYMVSVHRLQAGTWYLYSQIINEIWEVRMRHESISINDINETLHWVMMGKKMEVSTEISIGLFHEQVLDNDELINFHFDNQVQQPLMDEKI